MELFKFIVMGLAGLGLGLGCAGSTNNKKVVGWIMAAVGFSILQYLGVKL
jgi:hypothetical protein